MILIWMPLGSSGSYICFYQCGFSIIWKFNRFNQNLHKQLQAKQTDFTHSKLQAAFVETAAARWNRNIHNIDTISKDTANLMLTHQ